jgi:hypothetical protein
VTAYAICAANALPGWNARFQPSTSDTQLSKTATLFCFANSPSPIGAGWNLVSAQACFHKLHG